MADNESQTTTAFETSADDATQFAISLPGIEDTKSLQNDPELEEILNSKLLKHILIAFCALNDQTLCTRMFKVRIEHGESYTITLCVCVLFITILVTVYTSISNSLHHQISHIGWSTRF